MMHSAKDSFSGHAKSAEPTRDPVSPGPIELALSDRDQLSRKLRISLVEHCNFGCFFCHNEGQGRARSRRPILSVDELQKLTRAAFEAGFTELKLTGGEPLLYRHGAATVVDVVRHISQARQGQAVGLSMTTNGLLLARHAEALAEAGLDRVTVSVHTLDSATMRSAIYARAGDDTVRRVVDGLLAAKRAGLSPLKINTVIFGAGGHDRGNWHELPGLLRLARSARVSELRLYTVLPHRDFAGDEFQRRYRYWNAESLRVLAEQFTIDARRVDEIAGEAQRLLAQWASEVYPKPVLRLRAADDLVVCIEPMEHARFADLGLTEEGPYALRLSASGKLTGVLGSDDGVDVLGMLRRGVQLSQLVDVFAAARRSLLPAAA